MAHVYLLHFTPKFKHARHYCGITPNGVHERIVKHRKGTGARLTRAAAQAGVHLRLVRTWKCADIHEAHVIERALKNTHNLRDHCPVCKAERKRNHKRA